jgi:hypothetical protein
MENEGLKEYKGTVNNIREIMKYETDLIRVFGGKLELIKKAVDIMITHIDASISNRDVVATGEEKSIVRESASLFVSIAVDQPIVPIFRDLSRLFMLLVFNWNKEFGKRKEIDDDMRLMSGLIEAQLTMFETMNFLKEMLKKAKETINYRPPAFDLSKHYLKTLEGQINNDCGCQVDPKKSNDNKSSKTSAKISKTAKHAKKNKRK